MINILFSIIHILSQGKGNQITGGQLYMEYSRIGALKFGTHLSYSPLYYIDKTTIKVYIFKTIDKIDKY